MEGSGPKLSGCLMERTETGFHNGNQKMKTTKTFMFSSVAVGAPVMCRNVRGDDLAAEIGDASALENPRIAESHYSSEAFAGLTVPEPIVVFRNVIGC
jgi:hypothetical protein